MYNVQLTQSSSIEIIEGESTENLLSKLTFLEVEERNNLLNSSKEILKNCINPSIQPGKHKYNDTTGLVLGYVQSGKTLSFTTVMALARDNNYRIAVLIAGRTNLLLQQNTDRLRDDIGDDQNIDVMEFEENADLTNKINKRLENNKNRLLIITVLKHQKHIRSLANIFKDPRLSFILPKKSILIFDDESDQASLNTKSNRNVKNNENKESSIFSSIKYLRSSVPNHTYIQYTATPQANLLIDYIDLLSPQWHVLISPGKMYTGGNTFFKDETHKTIKNIPDSEKYHYKDRKLEQPPKGLIDAIYTFIFSSIFLSYKNFDYVSGTSKMNKTAMMIHPCSRNESIAIFYNWTKNIINGISENIRNNETEILESKYAAYIKEFGNYLKNVPDVKQVTEIIYEDFMDNYHIHQVIGNAEKQAFPWKLARHHILVGGQLLDRGFTVEDLIITYMPRDTKGINNADTIEQRCRFFGYRRDYINFCRVYLPESLRIDYESYIEHETHLRETLSKVTLKEFKKSGSPMLTSNNLKLTNYSRVGSKLITSNLSGFQYFEPPLNYEKNNELTDEFLAEISEHYLGELKPNIISDIQDNNTHSVYSIEIETLISFISQFDIGNPHERIKLSHIERQLYYIKEKLKQNKVFLIQIAHKRKAGRPRTIKYFSDIDDNNPLKISSLASNFPDYFGDNKLLKTSTAGKEVFGYTDELIVQIHKIQALEKTPTESEIYGKSFYTLAFNFPEENSRTFISKPSIDAN